MTPGRPIEIMRAGELAIRRYRADDAARLHAAIVDSLEHLRPWMPWIAAEPLTVAQRQELITGTFDRGWSEGTDFVYGIFLRELVVGGCGLHRRIGANGLEIGYWIRAGYTCRGFATMAARALTEAAFACEDVGRVEIHHDKANTASSRVPAKLGFVLVREVQDGVAAPGEAGVSVEWRLERARPRP